MKYTKDILSPLVAESTTYSQVLSKLGLRQTGGSHAHIKRLVGKFKLDTSHFLGRGVNRGNRHRGGPAIKSAKEVLVLRKPTVRSTHTYQLRRALLEIGRPYRCEVCSIGSVWCNKSLTLQVDHRNGKRWDSRPKNVRFLCPNCHSQTKNFGSKNTNAPVAELAYAPR